MMKLIKRKDEGEVLPLQSINEDFLIEILLRLPVKTLFRFKCVCKRWQSLISHKSFGNSFIKRSKELGFPSLIHGFFHRMEHSTFSAGGELDFLSTSDDGGMISIDTTLSFISSIYPSIAVCYSNNDVLLCALKFGYPYPFRYIVCNPVTKQWITLPKPQGHCSFTEKVLLHVYDVDELCSKTTQFIVMCFIRKHNDLLQVEMFCSKRGKWNKPKLCYYHPSLTIGRLTYFNGSVYWIHDEQQIAVYSLKEESVGFVKMPPDTRLFAGLGVSGGLLYFTETTPKCFQVWAFVNGGEFSLKHRIEFESFKASHLYREGFTFQLMGLHPLDYQLVLVKCNEIDRAALYHMEKRSLEVVDAMHHYWVLWCGFYRAFPYFLPAWPTCIPYIRSTKKANKCMLNQHLKIMKKRCSESKSKD